MKAETEWPVSLVIRLFCYRENVDWDVKMAMEFKERQRKIVSSILDSCSAGIKLVQEFISSPPV